jgi:hypothetical protein
VLRKKNANDIGHNNVLEFFFMIGISGSSGATSELQEFIIVYLFIVKE